MTDGTHDTNLPFGPGSEPPKMDDDPSDTTREKIAEALAYMKHAATTAMTIALMEVRRTDDARFKEITDLMDEGVTSSIDVAQNLMKTTRALAETPALSMHSRFMASLAHELAKRTWEGISTGVINTAQPSKEDLERRENTGSNMRAILDAMSKDKDAIKPEDRRVLDALDSVEKVLGYMAHRTQEIRNNVLLAANPNSDADAQSKARVAMLKDGRTLLDMATTAQMPAADIAKACGVEWTMVSNDVMDAFRYVVSNFGLHPIVGGGSLGALLGQIMRGPGGPGPSGGGDPQNPQQGG